MKREPFATLIWSSPTRFRMPRKVKKELKTSYLRIIGLLAANARGIPRHLAPASRIFRKAMKLRVRMSIVTEAA
jgi:hypothetical protein